MAYEVIVSNRGDSGVVSDVGIVSIRKRPLEPSHQSADRTGERFLSCCNIRYFFACVGCTYWLSFESGF